MGHLPHQQTMKSFPKTAKSQIFVDLVARSLAVAAVTAGFLGLPSHAVSTRYILDYETFEGDGTLSGYIDIDIDIDISDPLATTTYNGTPLPAWLNGLVLNLTDGATTTTYTKDDLDALWWIPNSPTVSWSSDLAGQFSDISFGQAGMATIEIIRLSPKAISSYPIDVNKYELISATPATQPVPGPIPLLGLGTAFCLSRQLRRRQRMILSFRLTLIVLARTY
jgi:hypothetical protein